MRVLQYGVGAMGALMIHILSSKTGVEIVAAIDSDPNKIGRDLGEVAGLGNATGKMVQPISEYKTEGAEIALHATTAFAAEAYPILSDLISRGLNVVTITQELFFPIGRNIEIARQLDEEAKNAGVRITAAGINPGFILDMLPIAASLPCRRIDKITGTRVVDFSPYGPDEMKHIAAGLTEDEFIAGARRGEFGHIGLLESSAMVAHALALGVDELRQTKSPIVTKTPRRTSFVSIDAGRVCGFRQSVTGYAAGQEKLHLQMLGLLAPTADDPALGDQFRIEGDPCVDVVTQEQISQRGGLGTAAVAVNTIPRIMHAEPGFHTSNELIMPSIWRDPLAQVVVSSVSTTIEGAH